LKDDKTLRRAAWPFGLAGAAFLTFMTLYTTATVVMRQGLGIPTLGVVDVMELALVAMIFLALPGSFLRDEHVTIDVIDQLVSRRVRVALRFLGLFLTLILLVIVLRQVIPAALYSFDSFEVTMTLGIHRSWHWSPIVFGFSFSVAAVVWVILYYWRYGVPRDPNLDRDLAD
jgi:TRAP-type C4-dicarboxylate transport system permease small subunit